MTNDVYKNFVEMNIVDIEKHAGLQQTMQMQVVNCHGYVNHYVISI